MLPSQIHIGVRRPKAMSSQAVLTRLELLLVIPGLIRIQHGVPFGRPVSLAHRTLSCRWRSVRGTPLTGLREVDFEWFKQILSYQWQHRIEEVSRWSILWCCI